MTTAKSSRETVSATIAETIGNPSMAGAVQAVIDAAVSGEYIFHGIKNARSLGQIAAKGILPLTPETTCGVGADVSFWTSQDRLFSNGDPVMWSFDTSFFHYAHTIGEERIASMNLAVTSLPRLAEHGISVPKSIWASGYLAIGQCIPMPAIDILRVETPLANNNEITRNRAQILEQAMIVKLAEVL